jgi:mannose-6-phosphate isomerase-like protein (cupin superfamily)
VKRLGLRYPVVQDNDFATWNAYANQYWPAKYLIDRKGHVRFVHFGEGEYRRTENVIRRLLGLAPLGTEMDVPQGRLVTPESYLGYERLARYAGSPIAPGREAEYRLPSKLPQNELAYGGEWRVEGERIVAGRGARLRLHFHASDVFLVLGGRGRVDIFERGRKTRTVRVDAYRLYTLRRGAPEDAVMELRVTPGVAAYAFTFG